MFVSRDILSFSTDFTFRRFLVKVPSVFFHIAFWALFISYEVSLAAAISNNFGHILDYLLHYLLYVGTFYYHCYRTLNFTMSGRRKRWAALLLNVAFEIAIFFICGTLISAYLESLQVERKWSYRDAGFIFANIYRCIYILGGSTAYWFVLHLVRKERRLSRMRNARLIAAVEKEKLKLALAKSMINPHMLFNTLNFLYNEVRKVDKPIAQHIMSLSELMRYALIDISKEDTVELSDEINYVENYIGLHKKRIPSHIVLLKEGTDNQALRILPLIIVTLTENILQHGKLDDPYNPAVIKIVYAHGILRIQTKNRVRPDASGGHGMGVKNLKKRLLNAYGGSFEYYIENNGTTYESFLSIKIN